jgi:hypothetical protein
VAVSFIGGGNQSTWAKATDLPLLNITSVMFSNYRSYYNKEPEQRCMTDHRIKNNPLSSFENKQRRFSNINYMVFFTYFTIYGTTVYNSGNKWENI